MKYKVGDKIKQSGRRNWLGRKSDLLTISAGFPCNHFPCNKKVCCSSGNVYQFEGGVILAGEGYCYVEEESELYVWKPGKPKEFKL